MKGRLSVGGGNLKNNDIYASNCDQPTPFEQYNDLQYASNKKFDFLQSSFLGQNHLKAAVAAE